MYRITFGSGLKLSIEPAEVPCSLARNEENLPEPEAPLESKPDGRLPPAGGSGTHVGGEVLRGGCPDGMLPGGGWLAAKLQG